MRRSFVLAFLCYEVIETYISFMLELLINSSHELLSKFFVMFRNKVKQIHIERIHMFILFQLTIRFCVLFEAYSEWRIDSVEGYLFID